MVGWGLFLRAAAAAAAALSLAAAVVLSLDNQTTMVALRRVIVPVTAKRHYFSAFVHFVVANAIPRVWTVWYHVVVVVVSDLVTTALLFSSFGAAVAVGLIGREGNSHVQWRKVCDVFEKFWWSLQLAIFNLHNKN
ncbi:CASP-like protein 1E2 [Salvia miltiorrhiza]|uniref:CASP-like protein 1E2 n=1 Tax=Salvia miltiorrhiza TaxID=226208 RepID=UPI0025ACE659|nr:CASP-like protein 1E2 [Salvia miltiorrhiza]